MPSDYVRFITMGDFHSGSEVGLTYPDFNPVYRRRDTRDWKLSQFRTKLWKKFDADLELVKPAELLLVNGDAIDGKGDRSGGVEQISVDRNWQVDNAVAIIEHVKKKTGVVEVYMTYGTPYHVGKYEDWEKQIADKVGAIKIGGHDRLDVNGTLFDYRHFVSSSSIPHGRGTPLAKERLWNLLWAEHGEYPKAHVILRSHVHYFHIDGGFEWRGYILPALQAAGTKIGTRKYSVTVDWGFLAFDVYGKLDYICHEFITKFRTARQHTMKALASRR